jgi:hypothetical protein
MNYDTSVRELAFELWYKHGGNDSETVRALKAEDYVITRKTVGEWREKYGWKERAARLDAVKQTAADRALSFEEELLRDLISQKKRYDDYFASASTDKPDTQAMFVYMQVVKQIKELNKEIKPKDKKQIKKGLEEKAAQDIKRAILGIDNDK